MLPPTNSGRREKVVSRCGTYGQARRVARGGPACRAPERCPALSTSVSRYPDTAAAIEVARRDAQRGTTPRRCSSAAAPSLHLTYRKDLLQPLRGAAVACASLPILAWRLPARLASRFLPAAGERPRGGGQVLWLMRVPAMRAMRPRGTTR